MESDELLDGELRSFGGLDKIRSVVMRWNLDLATILKCRATPGLREPHDLALGIGGRETKRIEPYDDGCIRRDRATVSHRVPRVRERTRTVGDRLIDVVADLDEQRAVAEGADP
jgi:hypothetical protein